MERVRSAKVSTLKQMERGRLIGRVLSLRTNIDRLNADYKQKRVPYDEYYKRGRVMTDEHNKALRVARDRFGRETRLG